MTGSPQKRLVFLFALLSLLLVLVFLGPLFRDDGKKEGLSGGEGPTQVGSLTSRPAQEKEDPSLVLPGKGVGRREGVIARTLLIGRVEGGGEFPFSPGRVLLLPAPPPLSGGLGGMIQGLSQGKDVRLLAPNKSKERALAETPLSKDGDFRFVSPPVGRFSLVLDHPFLYFEEPPLVETRKNQSVTVGPFHASLGSLVEVRATDSQGLPLGGVLLRVQGRPDFSKMMDPAKAGDPRMWIENFLPMEKKTNERGLAFFRGLVPGSYVLHGSRRSFASRSQALLAQKGIRRIVRLVFSKGLELDVSLKGPDGKPVIGVGVRVVPARGVTTWGMGFSGARMKKESISRKTDARGIAHFDTLSPGLLSIRVRAPGFVEARREFPMVGGRTELVELTLDRGLAFEGVVTDSRARPIKGARVASLREAGQEFMGFSGASFLPRKVFEIMAKREGVVTDAAGRFNLFGFRKGRKTKLFAIKDGFTVQQTPELVAGTRGIRIPCRKQAVLEGKVLDARTGTPIRSYTVKVGRNAFMMFQTLLGEKRVKSLEGTFRMDGLSPGAAQITIQAEGKNQLQLSKTLREGGNQLGVLEMKPPLVVEGRVVDPQGNGLVGVELWVSRGRMADNPEMHQLMGLKKFRSGQGGNFRLVGVPTGRFRLGAYKKGWSLKRSRVLRVPEKTGVLRGVLLEMGKGGTVEGVILSAQGLPATGAWVQAKRNDQGFSQSATSDANGRFRFTGLAEGTYVLVGMKKSFFEEMGRETMKSRDSGPSNVMKRVSSLMKKMARVQVRVREGETTKVRLRVPASTGQGAHPDLWGWVRVGAAPLAQGLVSLTPVGAGLIPLMGSVEQGKFRIENVPDGNYRIRFLAGFGTGPVGEEKELRVSRPRRPLRFSFPGSLLEGRVLRPDGSPAGAGLMVRLWKQGGRRESIDDPNPWLNGNATLTVGNGRFRFEGLPQGTYDLEVRSIGFLGKSQGSGELRGVALGDGERRTSLEIRLSEGGELQVQVLASGRPLRRAVVQLLDAKGKPKDLFRIMVTDGEGKALFERVPEGEWRVLARGRGWASKLSAVRRVRGGAPASVSLELTRGIPVELEIPKGPKLRGLSIFSVWRLDGAFVLQGGIPGQATKISLGRLEPGTYRLRVENAALGRREQEVVVPARGTAHWLLPK